MIICKPSCATNLSSTCKSSCISCNLTKFAEICNSMQHFLYCHLQHKMAARAAGETVATTLGGEAVEIANN